MIGELIQTAYTYDQGRVAINDAFSGQASFNAFSAQTMVSGSTNLYDIFYWSGSTFGAWENGIGNNSVQTIGTLCVASGNSSVAEGSGTTAGGLVAHSEGYYTLAGGDGSHVEGAFSISSGLCSHVGGVNNESYADYSFVQGGTTNVLTKDAVGSSIISGLGITGTSAFTLYTSSLNIKTVKSSISVTNLGVDADGFVVSATSMHAGAFLVLTYSSTTWWNYSQGASAEVTLTGNTTLSVKNMVDGDYGTLLIKQDAVGGWGITLPLGSRVVNGGGAAVLLTSAANAHDILSFVYRDVGAIQTFYWNVGYNYT